MGCFEVGVAIVSYKTQKMMSKKEDGCGLEVGVG